MSPGTSASNVTILLLALGIAAASARRDRLPIRRKLHGKMMGGGGKMHVPKVKTTTKKAVPIKAPAGKMDKKGACAFDFSADQVEDLCTLFEVFDNMGRYENDNPAIPGFEWGDLCDDFAPFNDWLCPSDDVVQLGICSHRRPWLNPSIRQFYCGPLLENMPEGPRRESCETWCTNYVSQDRGDCCDIQCQGP